MTDENPNSMQDLASSNESPWSRCKVMGMLLPISLAILTAPIAMYRSRVWFAYSRAPLDTWRMTGDLVSAQPMMIACSCSMLLKL